MTNSCSPGSHPHSDRPNWQPAQNIDNYLRNCRDGLEVYSDSQAAKLLGWSRIHQWRVRMAGRLPDELFDKLVKQRSPQLTMKGLADAAVALERGEAGADAKTCPHCGGLLRIRRKLHPKTLALVNEWLASRGS